MYVWGTGNWCDISRSVLLSRFVCKFWGLFCNVQDPEAYVQELLKVYKKYKKLIMEYFSNEPLFVQALDEVILI